MSEDIVMAKVWIKCPFSENTRHKLQKGNHTPFYECECLGISMGVDLQEGDEVIIEELEGVE